MGGRAKNRPTDVGALHWRAWACQLHDCFPMHDFGVFIAVNRRDSGNRIGMLIKLWKRFLTNRVAGWWAV